MDFKASMTKSNLMRAFAGESQAQMRYTIAASAAEDAGHEVIGQIFRYTARQEKEHAEIFYKHLRTLAGDTIRIDGGYPIDLSDDVATLLRMAQHNEYEEYNDVYKSLGDTAREEGFAEIAASFYLIADIEKTHGDRFGTFAELLESGALYSSHSEEAWICLNCGHIVTASQAPSVCPVCHHNGGYFIRLSSAPYTASK